MRTYQLRTTVQHATIESGQVSLNEISFLVDDNGNEVTEHLTRYSVYEGSKVHVFDSKQEYIDYVFQQTGIRLG